MTQKERNIIEKFKKKVVNELEVKEFDYEYDNMFECIYLHFPHEEEESIEYSIDQIEIYLDELDSIKFYQDCSKVTTNTITQKVIQISSKSNFYYLLALGLFYKQTPENIYINIVQNPLLIGIGAVKSNNYNDYNPPCSSHLAIEINYPDFDSRLSEEKENELIKIFMFELSHAHNISFEFSTYMLQKEYDFDDAKIDILHSTDFIYNIPLEEYNYGMDLFLNANQKLSPDLQFISYYKIFEYYAPIQAKIEAFESMKLKLSSSKALTHDANFIASIFELAKNYDRSVRDSELIKSLINTAFDLVDLYDDLPQTVKKKLKQNELKYNSKTETKDRIVNELGAILYQTRNSIVHAKSNYDIKGSEIEINDLPELNHFMHKASYSIIRWYSSLPKHLKINA
ncbi:hypothetical protein BSF41_35730 [Flavobacterium sp. ACN2]|uniref:hypothetical protein n=1 Tax=Flavobacterium sp. ACN2 TaxID=1975676 RepID=UPI000BB38068|nr:hypothetical protein [Flavobacterium sp. ACN2]PBI86089.1 hypothetical protein BSF41_35730 [Flavobacterium sp. ACN2]